MDNNDNLLDEVELNDFLLLLQERITTLRPHLRRHLSGLRSPCRHLDEAIESLFVIETKILKMLQ